MRLKRTDGRVVHINLAKHKTARHFSKPQLTMRQILGELFNFDIYEEVYCDGVYFDFLIPQIGLVIEVDGKQHYDYVPFFYKNAAQFIRAIRNDEKKEKLCKLNNLKLIRIPAGSYAKMKKLLIEKLKTD